MRKILRPLVWCGCVYLVLCTLAAAFLAHVTLYPQRRLLSAGAETQMGETAEQFGAHLQDVETRASDQVPLRAWYLEPEHANHDVVLLLHGLGDNRLGMTGYAEMLLKHGYRVLMPDARSHGISGGDLATYGVIERDDIRHWFEWLQNNAHPYCIFGLGESMGAAQLLQSLAAEPNFCAVVAESSFSTFREIAYDRMGQHFNAGPWVGRTILRPVVEIALLMVRMSDHIDLTQASPADFVASTRVPVLLIHGQVDGNIPVRHSRLIKARNSRIELWEVPAADHCGAISIARAEFESRVVGWFEMHEAPSARDGTQTAASLRPMSFHDALARGICSSIPAYSSSGGSRTIQACLNNRVSESHSDRTAATTGL
jgi:dipeptidyl aminopeptidase/acylaminoacyl peptidase